MRTTRSVAVIGFVTTSLAIVLVPLILIPSTQRSQYFWYRIAWAGVLALMIWGHAFVKVGQVSPRFAGVLPAYGILVIAYTAVSLSLMVGFAWLDPSASSNRIHIALQVGLGALLVIVSALLVLPASFASAGAPVPTTADQRPFHLVSQIRSQEERFASGKTAVRLSDALKMLRERILYTLDGMSGVEHSPDYGELAVRVSRLCQSLSNITPTILSEAEIAARLEEIQQLIRMVATVSSSLTRRS